MCKSSFLAQVFLPLLIGLVSCTQQVNQPTGTTESKTPEQSSSVATTEATTTEKASVVATSSLLCDITKQIAQDTIDLTCLLQPGLDPHVYKPTPSDRKAIETADLVLYGGYNYEPSLIKIINATNTPAPKVAVYEQAVTEPLLGSEHEDEHEHETKEGEVSDPHVWHDATNGAKIAEVVGTQLKQITLEKAEIYQQNTQKLASELNKIDEWIKAQVATVPESNRKLVTTHDSFRYYASAYGFTVKGALSGLSTEEKPSAQEIKELVEVVKNSGVTAIFAETTTNPQLIKAVAVDAKVKVADQPLFVEGTGGEGTIAPTYQKMLQANTCTIVNALGGKCSL